MTAAQDANLRVRVVTALVALPLVCLALYLGGGFTAGLLAFAAGACASEYLAITLHGGQVRELDGLSWAVVGLAAAAPLGPWLWPSEAVTFLMASCGVVIFLTQVWHLVRGPLQEAPVRSAHHLMALVYGAGGLTALMEIRQLPDGGWWTVAALVLTWGNDTTAYFGGRLAGRTKLYPEVSPGKTWEGLAAGFLGSVGGMFLLRALFATPVTPVDCVVLGLAAGVLGPTGDLAESMLKRAYGVKDSGFILPGHGGMLDRLDALLFNIPLLLLYLKLTVHPHL